MSAFTTNVNGRVNGAKLKEWVVKHAPVLNHFPELQQEFGRIAQAQRTADTYFTQAAERAPALRALADRGIRNTEDTIRNSAARFYLNAEPEDVVQRILSTRSVSERRAAAEQAMGMLKTPEAREGLARAYYDYVIKRTLGSEEREMPKGGWRGNFTKILEDEAPIADVLLTPGVRNRMRQLDRANVLENRRQTAKANDGARTAEDTNSPSASDRSVGHRIVQSIQDANDLPTVMGAATAGALAAAPMGATASGLTAVGAGGLSYLSKHALMARAAAKEAALREAVFNPDVFEKVMSSASLDKNTRQKIAKRILPYVLIANTEAAGSHARQ